MRERERKREGSSSSFPLLLLLLLFAWQCPVSEFGACVDCSSLGPFSPPPSPSLYSLLSPSGSPKKKGTSFKTGPSRSHHNEKSLKKFLWHKNKNQRNLFRSEAKKCCHTAFTHWPTAVVASAAAVTLVLFVASTDVAVVVVACA